MKAHLYGRPEGSEVTIPEGVELVASGDVSVLESGDGRQDVLVGGRSISSAILGYARAAEGRKCLMVFASCSES